MKIKDFRYDKFNYMKEEKNKIFNQFIAGDKNIVPVMQRPTVADHWGSLCRYREKSLESQLDFLNMYFELKSDFIYSYLEPWHGVGIYASAYGCPFNWCDHDAPQTEYIYHTLDDIKNFKNPDISNCEIMQMVLETIRYFKEKTGNMLDICLTDTQSPNDTASLIMDACEFFMISATEPEELFPFLQSITDTIISFTESQMNLIGDNLTIPGHAFPSSKNYHGIAVSDDNMAILSPSAYVDASYNYNNQLSEYFNGIAIHSCGNIVHNVKQLLEMKNLVMLDCAIGKASDPTPNDAKILAEIFKGSNTILKVRMGIDNIDFLSDIVSPDIRLIVEITGDETIYEKNIIYEKVKQRIDDILR